MKRLYSSFRILFILIFILQSIPALAGVYKRVTSVDELHNNDNVIFLAIDNNSNYLAMSKTQTDTYRLPVPVVSLSDDYIYDPNNEAQIVQLVKKNSSWNLKVSGGYLNHPSANNYLTTSSSAQSWTISSVNDNKFEIKRYNESYYIQYSHDYNRFSSYTDDFVNPFIYKLVSETEYYNREISAVGNFVTLCLPYDSYINGTAYEIAGRESDKLLLKEVSSLQGGVPYIVKSDYAEIVAVYKNNESKEVSSHNGLIGSYTGCSVSDGMYLLSNNTIKRCGTGCSIGAYRAYIDMDQVPTFNQAREKGMIEISGDGVVDFINSINEDSTGSDHIFNLNGVRTNALTRGLNIIKQSNGTVKKLYKK